MICELIQDGFKAFEAECIVKIFLDKKSVRETAKELGRSPGNVSDAITRARKRCANPTNALRIKRGRRLAEFRRQLPTPFSQLGKDGLKVA